MDVDDEEGDPMGDIFDAVLVCCGNDTIYIYVHVTHDIEERRYVPHYY